MLGQDGTRLPGVGHSRYSAVETVILNVDVALDHSRRVTACRMSAVPRPAAVGLSLARLGIHPGRLVMRRDGPALTPRRSRAKSPPCARPALAPGAAPPSARRRS